MTEAEEAELVVDRMQDVPRGLLRVTTPLCFGYLGPFVASFLKRYPEVRIEMVCADRIVDLIQEGFDVAVRAAVDRKVHQPAGIECRNQAIIG